MNDPITTTGNGTLREQIENPSSLISTDSLLDTLAALHADCQPEAVKRIPTVESFVERYGKSVGDVLQGRINPQSFNILKVLGRGAFGEVQLVKHKTTSEVYALKKLSKCEMLKKKDIAFFWEERNIMAFTESPWLVKLHHAFQDDQHLYMVMDFMAGGDMQSLLENFEFTEDWTRFYIAEIVLAIEAVHEMGYAHRDIKPDNVLLDVRGHVKLGDFGTCIRVDDDGKVRSKSAVGTPDYISPEVLESQDSTKPYTVHCDWWSLGVMLYEFMCTDCPFYCDTLAGTYNKIQQHQPDKLTFPDGVEISDAGKDLMTRLLARKSERIGTKGGCDEIRSHPFFESINWENISAMSPPHEAELTSPEDASSFPDPEPRDEPEELFKPARKFEGNQLPFIGFTFSRMTPMDQLRARGMLTSTPAATPALARVAGTDKKNRRRSANQRDSILALRSSEFEAQLLQDENETLTTEVNGLKSQVVSLKAELEATADLSTMSHAAASEHNDLETSRLANDQLIELERLQALEQERVKEVTALKASVEGLTTERDSQERRVAAGAKRSDEVTAEMVALQGSADAFAEQLAEERTKKTQMSQELALLTAQVEDHKAAQSQLQHKCERAVKSRSTIETANEEMGEDLRRVQRKLTQAAEEVEEGNTYSDQLRRKNSVLAVEIMGLKSDNRQLEEDRVRLEGKVTRLSDSIETPESRAAADGGAHDISAQKLLEVEVAHAEALATLEKQLTDEREARQKAVAELAELNLRLQERVRDLAKSSARLEEEEGNCMDLASELEEKTSQYGNLVIEHSNLHEEKALLKSNNDVLEVRCDAVQIRLATLTEQLHYSTARVDELTAERGALIPREQLTTAEVAIRDLAVQVSKLENQHNIDLLHLKTERDLAAKVHATSSETLTEFRKEQLMSVENVKAEYEVKIVQLTRQLRVKNEEYDALAHQTELDIRNLRAQNTASRRRMTIRRSVHPNMIADAGNQMDPESRYRKVEKKNKSLEQELNTLRKKLEDIEAESSVNLEQLQAEFDTAKDEWAVSEEALRRANHDLQEDLGRKSDNVTNLSTSLNKATNRLSLMRESISPQTPERPLGNGGIMEGVLWQPKKGNMKRHGWEQLAAKIDLSGFSLLGDGPDVSKWAASCVKKASKVRPEEVIHAKSIDVPCILQLVLVKVTQREEKSGAMEVFAAVHDKVDNDKYHFQGHLFERALLDGSELCMVCKRACSTTTSVARMIGTGKNRPFNCIHCTKLVHLQHITNNELSIGTCSGMKVENKTLLLKAASPSECDEWLECFQLLIQRQLKVVELERGYIDTKYDGAAVGAVADTPDAKGTRSASDADTSMERSAATPTSQDMSPPKRSGMI